MTEEIVGEEEKTSAGEPTKTPEEQTPSPLGDEPPKKTEEDWKTEVEQAKANIEQWKNTADSYKREIEVKGLRQKRYQEITSPLPVENYETELSDKIKDDFLSKKSDIIDEYKDELVKLPEDEWRDVQTFILPAVDSLFYQAVKENRFVARGEIRRALEKMVKPLFSPKDEEQRKKELENARLKGIEEAQKMEDAELRGVKNRQIPGSKEQITDEDKKYSEESGGAISPERAAQIRLSKEAREKEYSQNISG